MNLPKGVHPTALRASTSEKGSRGKYAPAAVKKHFAMRCGLDMATDAWSRGAGFLQLSKPPTLACILARRTTLRTTASYCAQTFTRSMTWTWSQLSQALSKYAFIQSFLRNTNCIRSNSLRPNPPLDHRRLLCRFDLTAFSNVATSPQVDRPSKTMPEPFDLVWKVLSGPTFAIGDV